MGTKNHPGKFDCYIYANGDEPLFTLLGRDRHAPSLVRLWALQRHKEGENEDRVSEALTCADEMDAELLRRGKNPVGSGSKFESIFLLMTTGMVEHPEGFDQPCNCDLCLSYD